MTEPAESRDGALVELVESVRQLPYGRPSEPTPKAMLREGRGTCSAKHLYLQRELAARFPETEPEIVHRVYRISPDSARERWGERVAATVPPGGLVDVHRYLTATVAGRRIVIDATFPGKPWDGRSSLPLACGPGEDHPAGADPTREKRELERLHCDPAVREPFIVALSG